MRIPTLIAASAALALAAGAAHAGEGAKKHKDQTAATPPATTSSAPSTAMTDDMSLDNRAAASPPSVYAGAADATSVGADASAVTTTRLITNGPIPDTAENRARYGQPMSRAGRMTEPAGN
ncbi:MAG: hypothetical protein ACK41C_14035 [Phenylobacterium sp.]|uniref:hypothetical protein n=1 Tax=Phenylobacterium sp. TaxID=1871053 RepID=UPI00391B08D0